MRAYTKEGWRRSLDLAAARRLSHLPSSRKGTVWSFLGPLAAMSDRRILVSTGVAGLLLGTEVLRSKIKL